MAMKLSKKAANGKIIVLNVIGVAELYFQAQSAAGTYAMFFESFCVAAVIYFVLTTIVTAVLRAIERKMAGSSSYKLIEDEKTEVDGK